MSKNDDELNEFIDEVTDGAYNLPSVEVIFNLVSQMQPWWDERIKKIVIIKGLDNQDQKLNYQINQYPNKSLIVSLGPRQMENETRRYRLSVGTGLFTNLFD